MAYLMLPPSASKNLFYGHMGFQDRGLVGEGIPGYTRKPAYEGFDTPEPIGARYFPPEGKWDEETDVQLPIAAGYVSNGGRPAYRQRVFNAAKKDPKAIGMKMKDVDDILGPDAYGPDFSSKVAHKP